MGLVVACSPWGSIISFGNIGSATYIRRILRWCKHNSYSCVPCMSMLNTVYAAFIVQKEKDKQTMNDRTCTHLHLFKDYTKGQKLNSFRYREKWVPKWNHHG